MIVTDNPLKVTYDHIIYQAYKICISRMPNVPLEAFGQLNFYPNLPPILPPFPHVHAESNDPIKFLPEIGFHFPHRTMNYLCYNKRLLTLIENNNVTSES